jgi:hypothetical protein
MSLCYHYTEDLHNMWPHYTSTHVDMSQPLSSHLSHHGDYIKRRTRTPDRPYAMTGIQLHPSIAFSRAIRSRASGRARIPILRTLNLQLSSSSAIPQPSRHRGLRAPHRRSSTIPLRLPPSPLRSISDNLNPWDPASRIRQRIDA